jgi:hypothetical protein
MSDARRTAALLGAWVAAAALAGGPAGADSRPTADADARSAPRITHSGPECMAGRAPPPAHERGNDSP